MKYDPPRSWTFNPYAPSMYRRPVLLLMEVVMITALSGCPQGAKTYTSSVPAYPSLWTSSARPWAIIKCNYPDNATIPDGLDTLINIFLTTPPSGFGGATDYYSDVSYGAISFSKDAVFGWVPLPYTSTTGLANLTTQYGPGARYQGIVMCANALPGNIDFSKYYGVISVNNLVTGGGAAGIGPSQMVIHGTTYNLAAVSFDPNSMFVKFAAHEIGHGLGFPHSFENGMSLCGGGPGEYCDPWDIMSWPFSFFDSNYSATTYRVQTDANGNQVDIPNPVPDKSPNSGTGINVPNLLKQGWIPSNRIDSYTVGGASATYVLDALSHPTATYGTDPATRGALTVLLKTPGVTDDFYTLEYRQNDGWDEQIPANTVLIHEFTLGRYNSGKLPSYSYLQKPFDMGQLCFIVPTQCEMLAGKTWTDPFGSFKVTVVSIDPAAATATVTVGHP